MSFIEICTYKMRIIICSEITDLSQFQSLPRLVKTITVKDNTCNTASTSPLVLNGFSVLTHITIGRNSLKNIRWFTISSLPSLEVILIGSCSFSTICDGVPYVLITNSKLSIFDCPNLRTISWKIIHSLNIRISIWIIFQVLKQWRSANIPSIILLIS